VSGYGFSHIAAWEGHDFSRADEPMSNKSMRALAPEIEREVAEVTASRLIL
jgi:hypothetical protein